MFCSKLHVWSSTKLRILSPSFIEQYLVGPHIEWLLLSQYRYRTCFFHTLTFARSRGRCWKPRPKAAVFNTSQGTWWMLMHWKTMFDRYYCIKNYKHLLHFTLFLVLFCFAFLPMSRERNFHRLFSFYGPGSTHLVMTANMCPRYDHIESSVAVH